MIRSHFRVQNTLRTVTLLVALSGVLLLLGWLIGGPRYLWIFALFSVASAIGSYWFSDKIALRSMQAYPVTREQAPRIYRIVEELSQKAQQPMPRLYVSPTMSPNAFATGRNPRHAAVCCTEGILQLLDDRELRGVLGHELMHVYNRDILISSVAGAIASVIGIFAQMGFYMGLGRRDQDRGPATMIFALLAALLAPVASTVVQFAISRTREYDADESGAILTQDPLALASALTKISAGIQSQPLPPEPQLENASHMMIANPFSAGDAMRSLMATHPPVEKRIARLRAMADARPTNRDRYR
ncbi:zinc metalloprotease HtpX [Dermabacteraceae bacterium CCM 9519]